MLINSVKKIILISAVFIAFGCSSQVDKKIQQLVIQPQSNKPVFDGTREEKDFPLYVESLKKYAKAQGIDDKTIKIAFDGVYYIDHVVKADKNQPEKKVAFDDYLARTVSPIRIEQAKQKYQEYSVQLKKASELTQVPAPYILALWGSESGYGRYQGTEDIISALSTLAFEGRREIFFTKELISALKILQNGHIEKSQFKGSWAGAMGQNQFMPSSYLAYGLDGDGDGKIDIWNNMADIFASIGNYLHTIGWDKNIGWGNKIRLNNNFDKNKIGLENNKSRTIKEWLQQDIEVIDTQALPVDSTQAWIIIPDENTNYGYLVYSNFKTLMHWNRSYHFAVSVGMLAESVMQ